MNKEKVHNWLIVIFFLVLFIGIFFYVMPLTLNVLTELAYGILGIIIGIYLVRQIIQANHFQYYWNKLKNQESRKLTTVAKIKVLSVIIIYGIIIFYISSFVNLQIGMGITFGLMLGYFNAETNYRNIDDYLLIEKKVKDD